MKIKYFKMDSALAKVSNLKINRSLFDSFENGTNHS